MSDPFESEIWIAPSGLSLLIFVAIVLTIVGLFVLAARKADRRWTGPAAIAAGLWLAATAALAESGLIESGLPISLMASLAGFNLVALAIAFSPFGTRLADATSIVALVGFQAFRLPLELVLHHWYEEGVIPITMTWEGRNLDVITGILALAAIPMLQKRSLERWQRPIAIAFSAIGLALLANVAVTAVLSSPVPMRRYFEGPPLQLAFHAPTIWIVSVCVAGALCGHLLLIRKLLRTSGSATAPTAEDYSR